MKQNLVVFLLAFSVITSAQSISGVEAKIEQLLKLSGAEGQFLGAIDNMQDMQQQAGNSSVPGEPWSEFRAEIHRDGWNQIRPKLVEVYRGNFSEEEIDHRLAYLSDPVPQQMIAKQSAIMSRSMQIGERWGQALALRIMSGIQVRKYDKE